MLVRPLADRRDHQADFDHGERAAASIRDYLLSGRTHVRPEQRLQKFLARNKLLVDQCLEHAPLAKPRASVPELAADERIRSFEEVDGVITKETAYEEAGRCLRCYRLYSLVTEKALNGGQAHAAHAAGAKAKNGAPGAATTIAG